jgi:hypothetical protein
VRQTSRHGHNGLEVGGSRPRGSELQRGASGSEGPRPSGPRTRSRRCRSRPRVREHRAGRARAGPRNPHGRCTVRRRLAEPRGDAVEQHRFKPRANRKFCRSPGSCLLRARVLSRRGHLFGRRPCITVHRPRREARSGRARPTRMHRRAPQVRFASRSVAGSSPARSTSRTLRPLTGQPTGRWGWPGARWLTRGSWETFTSVKQSATRLSGAAAQSRPSCPSLRRTVLARRSDRSRSR